MAKPSSGNPLLPGKGVCDPHVRIYDGRAYLYATHDKSSENQHYVMEDWWIWSSDDLVNWRHECTIKPEDTYYGKLPKLDNVAISYFNNEGWVQATDIDLSVISGAGGITSTATDVNIFFNALFAHQIVT